ncbi:signal recognition particle protein [Coleophoma cylindrospora]|uniref:Signal recognition particle subunit SRP14 n=1 Tax=Coleophoma cylindrospora TaxID=1849047 RepID=A0A3D8R1K3_9HELO|nr:signal recognition particle protein [Coleophoma cylindrospora]
MANVPLSNEDFFLRLADLFEERRKKDHGSVFLTQKRMTYGEDENALDGPHTTSSLELQGLQPSKPAPIIIRATNGKSKEKRSEKIKLSTIVQAEELESFFVKYAEICKLGMSGLKKRDRSRRKKETKAKKKKGAIGAGEDATKNT